VKHELKCDPIYFQQVWDLKKKSELRKNDRSFRQGDQVLLREYSRTNKKYSGRQIRTEISYVTDFPEALQNDFVMICLETIYRAKYRGDEE